jgi:hypothetical protein
VDPSFSKSQLIDAFSALLTDLDNQYGLFTPSAGSHGGLRGISAQYGCQKPVSEGASAGSPARFRFYGHARGNRDAFSALLTDLDNQYGLFTPSAGSHGGLRKKLLYDGCQKPVSEGASAGSPARFRFYGHARGNRDAGMFPAKKQIYLAVDPSFSKSQLIDAFSALLTDLDNQYGLFTLNGRTFPFLICHSSKSINGMRWHAWIS